MFITFAKLHVRRHIFQILGLRTSKREPLNEAVSLDAPLPGNDDENITVSDTIADPSSEAQFEGIESSDIAAEVLERVSALPLKQSEAVRGRFWEDKTLAQIGAELGLTPKQMQNQYGNALRKLRCDRRLQEIHDEFYAVANLTKHTGFRFFKENRMSSVE
jgi:DNA-directed RNA polymerase sigma subunit (sigma70/sigma32)